VVLVHLKLFVPLVLVQLEEKELLDANVLKVILKIHQESVHNVIINVWLVKLQLKPALPVYYKLIEKLLVIALVTLDMLKILFQKVV